MLFLSSDQQLGASVVWLRGGQESVQGEQNDRHARLPHRRALWRMSRQTPGTAMLFDMLLISFFLWDNPSMPCFFKRCPWSVITLSIFLL